MQHLSQHELDTIIKVMQAQEQLEAAVNEAIKLGLGVKPHVFFLGNTCHITTRVIPKKDHPPSTQPSKQLDLFA